MWTSCLYRGHFTRRADRAHRDRDRPRRREGAVRARRDGPADRDRQDRPLRVGLLLRRDPRRALLRRDALRRGEPDWPERDRFLLGKGHVAVGLYPLLADWGFFPPDAARRATRGSATRSATTPTCAWCRASISAPARSATRSRSGVGMALGGRACRARDFDVFVAARRRRAERGPGLGSGAGGRPHRRRQPGRDRRPQQLSAGRHGRRRDRHRAARATSGGRSAGRSHEVDGHDVAALLDRCCARCSTTRSAQRRRSSSPTRSRARASRTWRRAGWHLGYLAPRGRGTRRGRAEERADEPADASRKPRLVAPADGCSTRRRAARARPTRSPSSPTRAIRSSPAPPT